MLIRKLTCSSLSAASVLLFASCLADRAQAQESARPPVSRIVVNEEDGFQAALDFGADPQFDAVVSIEFAGGGSFCSGSLIAPGVVLSARHCGTEAGNEVVFGDNTFADPEFIAEIAEVILPEPPPADLSPDDAFDFVNFSNIFDGGDVAILLLEQDVPESVATPLRLTTETDALVGETAFLVGFGGNGVGEVGVGGTPDSVRLAGTNVIDTFGLPQVPPFPGDVFGDTIFSTDFDDGTDLANTIPGSDPTPSELEVTTAGGDSGSPLLVEIDGELLIAGVLSGGINPIDFAIDSSPGDVSVFTGIQGFQAQIEAAGGVFATAVPEPTSAVLLMLSLTAFAARRKAA